MIILAVDTSGPVASAAIMQDGKLIYEAYQNHGLTHSQYFMNLVDQTMQNTGFTMPQLDLIAACVGPGSFTGVRIGVSAARGLAHAYGTQAAAVNTLDALAFNASLFSGKVCPMLDARRGEVYTAVYDCSDPEAPRRLSDYLAVPVRQAVELAGEAVYLGDGAAANRSNILQLCAGARFAPAHLNLQRASGVAMAARQLLLQGEVCDHNGLVPFYIRKPQAEREYLERMEAGK